MKSEKNFILERKERDFLKAFDAVVKEFQMNNIAFKTTDVCKVVANMPAPRFYVSLEQALTQYRLYKSGRSDIRSTLRRSMFAEIFVRFEEIMEKSAGSMYMYTAMEMVLLQQAPCFYLNDISSVLFYYNAMKKKKLKAKGA